MRDSFKTALLYCETDIEGALQRFCGNEALYLSCLDNFRREPTMDKLREAIEKKEWTEAFDAAHALKGLAGNLGFIPLYHATGEMIVLLRAGREEEIGDICEQAKYCYKKLIEALDDRFNLV